MSSLDSYTAAVECLGEVMRRREFIALVGGGAAAMWPLATQGAAWQIGMRRIGVLFLGEYGYKTNRDVLKKALQELGWIDGQNVQIDYRFAANIERVISSLGNKPTAGLFVSWGPLYGVGPNLALTVSLAIGYHVPAVYSFRHFVEAGGLISYGNDLLEQYRQAAGYIDRILKGANPSNLPVQVPTKFEMVINLRTAKAMGITIPPTLIARADEVIE